MSIETKSNQNWLMDRFLLVVQFLVRVMYEPFRGAWSGEPAAIWNFAATCVMFTIFILGLDGKLLFYYGKGTVYDHRLYTTLQFFVMTNKSIYVGYTLVDESPIYLSNKMRTGHVTDHRSYRAR